MSFLLLLFGSFACLAGSPKFEFRETLRPGTIEYRESRYQPQPWSPEARKLVEERLDILLEQAPGLIDRASSDGPIGLIHIDKEGLSYAKGTYRLLVLNKTAFPYPGFDWLTRVIAHELTHSADPYDRLSSDREWRALIEPRIAKARARLEQLKLSVVDAASMPVGPKRDKVEADVLAASGLPSPYSSYTIEEATAEIVSFMVDRSTHYSPPPAVGAFLRKRLLDAARPGSDAAVQAFLRGIDLRDTGKESASLAQFTRAIALKPSFASAYMARGIAKGLLHDRAGARTDLNRAKGMLSRYSSLQSFIAEQLARFR